MLEAKADFRLCSILGAPPRRASSRALAFVVTPDQLNQWMAGEGLPGVRFVLNDSISIRSGVASGQTGAVISLLALAPEPR